ncbi:MULTISPECIES: hypothetical protein [unclassified Microcoleus]|nr:MULTISPECIES: hypothetical protein [unclassified Microcoleus]
MEFRIEFSETNLSPYTSIASMILAELQDNLKCDRAFASSPDVLGVTCR